MSEVLLQAAGLCKAYPSGRNLIGRPRQVVHAVRDVDLHVQRGETLAVVGESGAGKSTVGRLVLRLIEPDSGSVMLGDVDVLGLGRKSLRSLRKRMQMIFQDPFLSLDPRMDIAQAVGEPLAFHFGLRGDELRSRVLELLDRVGIGEHQAERYPYELSGGQLQRVAIARALAVEPELIVCDEPVAALDVSIQAQVINLLDDLQQERGVAYIFISHDLSLVRLIADRVAVMYRGRIVEEAPAKTLFQTPRHPYTRALIDVIPVPDPRRRSTRATSAIDIDPSAAERVTTGCSYAPRCPLAIERCWSVEPELNVVAGSIRVSCHLVLPGQPTRESGVAGDETVSAPETAPRQSPTSEPATRGGVSVWENLSPESGK